MGKRVSGRIRSWIAALVAMLVIYCGIVAVGELAGAPAGGDGMEAPGPALLSAETWLEALAAYPATLKLYAAVFVAVCGLGIPLGILWGGFRACSARGAAAVLGAGLMSVPAFCLAYGLLYYCVKTLQVPVLGGREAGGPELGALGRIAAEFWFVMMPASVLAIPAIGKVGSEVGKALAANMRCPSMMALTSRGLSRKRRLYRYALPATWGAVLHSLREALPPVMGASLLVEWVVRYPGMGSHCFEAVQRGDSGVVFAVLLLLGMTALAWHAVLDLAEAMFLEESEKA